MSVLPDQLSNFNYYVKKLPLYLQRSNGFQEHFRIWYDLLVGDSLTTGVKGVCDSVLQLLNIFDSDYLKYIASFEESGTTIVDGEYTNYGDKSDILDKLGALFGIKRSFTITYVDAGTTHYNEFINLNNEDFLVYIKFQIIKNNCEGTREQIAGFYKQAGLEVYIINQTISGSVNIYLVESANLSNNLRKLFLANQLVLQGMGIGYSNSGIDFSEVLYWDEETNGWDEGKWVI